MGYNRPEPRNVKMTWHEPSRLWVFGYGSLVWKTGFSYSSKRIGYVKGFVRRFWQGNTTHRGTPESPGRVATLVKNSETNRVWGVAFELVGPDEIQRGLEHLGMRECKLGGYTTYVLPFTPRDSEEPINVLVFSATTENSLYLGPASLEEMANQIIACKGATGHNVEYITRLADFTRDFIPEETDLHLFALDKLLRELLRSKSICLDCLISSSLPRNEALVSYESHVMDVAERICDEHLDNFPRLPMIATKSG